MKHNLLTLWVISVVATPIGIAQAVEPHAIEAIKHAQLGKQHGEKGDAQILTGHMKKALEHAEASYKIHTDNAAHLKAAITQIKAAIENGQSSHADVATEHAERALEHLKAGNQ